MAEPLQADLELVGVKPDRNVELEARRHDRARGRYCPRLKYDRSRRVVGDVVLARRHDITVDRDKREAMWHRLQEIYAEELPGLPLYFRADAHIWPKWLDGIRPTGHMFPSTLWVEQWGAGTG